MRENSVSDQWDSPQRKAQRRQMPERGRGGGTDSSSLPKKINEKDLGETDVPQRRTLRGVELPVSNSGETARDEADNTREMTMKERHPDWPPHIKVTIYGMYHGKKDDVPDLKEHIENIDIFFYEKIYPERVNELRENDLDLMNWISRNRLDDKDLDEFIETGKHAGKLIKGAYSEPLYRAISGSNVVVGHIDSRNANEDLKTLFDETYDVPDFDTTLDNLRKNIVDIAEEQNQREAPMTNEYLEEELEKIFREHPELKAKDEVSILFSVGKMHAVTLAPKFEEQEMETDVVIPNERFGYNHFTRLTQMFMAGEEPENIRELLAKAYISDFFKKELKDIVGTINDNQNADMYVTYLADHLSIDDIRRIHVDLMSGDTEKLDDTLDALFEERDLPNLPTDNDELDALANQLYDLSKDK